MATAYEKFEEAVKNMPRDEKINKLVDDVSQWDLDNLIGWAQEEMKRKLDLASDEDINCDYINAYDHDIDNFEDDEPAPTPQICKCDITKLMLFGHDNDCPERKS